MSMHPGGKKILRGAGKESSEMFGKSPTILCILYNQDSSYINWIEKYHLNMDIEQTAVALLFVGYLVDD